MVCNLSERNKIRGKYALVFLAEYTWALFYAIGGVVSYMVANGVTTIPVDDLLPSLLVGTLFFFVFEQVLGVIANMVGGGDHEETADT
jgi:hypothetical protein